MIDLVNKVSPTNSFFVKNGHILQRVNIFDICWIHSEGNYCTINTPNKKHVVKMSLTKIRQRLPVTGFIQIHRSYIVQTGLITHIDLSSNEVFLDNASLPMGRKYKEGLLKCLNMLQ